MRKRLFRLMVSLIVWLFDSVRDGVRRLIGLPVPARWVVLYYHTVTAAGRSSFARQMEIALRYALPLPADAPQVPAATRCFSVTFDDALADSLRHALPLLRARRIPAAVFVPTGFMGGTAGWEMIEGCGEADQRVMTTRELSCLDAGLVAIGSHTVTHPCLSTLRQEELEHELTESRRTLEELTGRQITMLSFPYGDYDARVCTALSKAGYLRAFSIVPTLVTGTQAPLVVGRVKADPSDWPIEFFLKIRGAYRWLAYASRAKAHFVPKKVNGRVVARRQPIRARARSTQQALVEAASEPPFAQGVRR